MQSVEQLAAPYIAVSQSASKPRSAFAGVRPIGDPIRNLEQLEGLVVISLRGWIRRNWPESAAVSVNGASGRNALASLQLWIGHIIPT